MQLRSFGTQIFDASNGLADEWDLISEIRSNIFCDEGRIDKSVEFDEFDESSRHVLGLSGDMPVAVARWRIFRSSHCFAIIDRFATSANHRNLGYGREMLKNILHDIKEINSLMGLDASGVFILAPVDSWVITKLNLYGFRVIDSEIIARGGYSFSKLFKEI